jgi:regulatory protein
MNSDIIFQRLAALCAKGEHCQHDMIEKMRRWEVDDETQAAVMARLVKERYVDDERYTRAFVHDKIAYNQWGRKKIEQALWMKHIDTDTARRVLDEVDDADYLAVLRPLIQQKARSIKAESEYERRGKLTKFALGRGFTMDIIRQVVGDCED